VTKARAALDHWLKELAPSPALRRWFAHDPAKWQQFERRYWKELADKAELADWLSRLARRRTVTLVYAARDEEHNGAAALKTFIERRKG
jgi:uncharacterized protein YeaO (DUF488 family)